MGVSVLERRLRGLPGVLDCAAGEEGVVLVVHPEVDPQMIELRAQIVLAEAGDRRPLLVIGGMSKAPRAVPDRVGRRRSVPHSPVSLVGFALLVLALLAVVPIAGQDIGSRRAPSVEGEEARARARGRARPPITGTDPGPPAMPQPVVDTLVYEAPAVEAPAAHHRPAADAAPAADAEEPVPVAFAPAPAPVSVEPTPTPALSRGKGRGAAAGPPHGKGAKDEATAGAGVDVDRVHGKGRPWTAARTAVVDADPVRSGSRPH